MRLRYILAISACIMGFAALSSAEIYRYRDANGVLRFTDNPAEIPENQLPESLQTYKKVEEFQPPGEEITSQPKTATPGAEENAETEETAPSDALIEQRRGLSVEHAEITKLTQKLNSEKALVKTPAERNQHNESVRLLNERIAAYESKRKVFEDNLKDFNEELNRKPAPSEAENSEAVRQAQENDIPLTVTQPSSEPEEEEEESAAAPAENEKASSDIKGEKTAPESPDSTPKEKAAASSEEDDTENDSEAENDADDDSEAESPAPKSKSSVSRGTFSDMSDEEESEEE